ncbi:hypothetical protein FOA43_003798 [Brettanomyces nanus]|uniref:Major facilitator superfamily (MFS) profile domain-containing protein n=1 Tax=Eeniella nana TaxID=13502 RepID=A0A875S9Y6_EENNA|nr:uncharacterized protein FOA43_003798 [Brettanomyces nanus]QPG76409.1 hypothetical protein FOA43_003798 [Brettanomyces nanus]
MQEKSNDEQSSDAPTTFNSDATQLDNLTEDPWQNISRAASIVSRNTNLTADPDDILSYDQRIFDKTNTNHSKHTLSRVQTFISEEINDEIPDTFTGWGLLSTIGCTIFNFNTWGSNSAYALYLQEYIHGNLFPGTSEVQFGAIGGLTFGSGLIFAAFINHMIGYFGLRQTIIAGAVVQFAGAMLASFSTKLWQLYCTQGVLQGIGMAMVAVPMVTIVPQWFKGGPGGKRNLAVGIQSAGSGIGGIVYNIGMEPILKQRGWHWALRTQAIICIVLNLIAVMMVKARDEHIKPIFKIYDKKVFSSFGCMVMMVWEMFTLLGYVTLMYTLGDFTRSLGYGAQQGSIVSTMVSVGIIYGRPIVGQFADIFGPVQTAILASWLTSLLVFAMWLPCKNYATAIAFALLEGSIMGTIWITMPTINGEVIGLQKFGIGMSLTWIAVGSSGLVSPIISIALKSSTSEGRSQYRDPTIFVGCCYFGAGLTLCVLRGWIIVRNELTPNLNSEKETLKVRVPPKQALRGFFRLGDYRV